MRLDVWLQQNELSSHSVDEVRRIILAGKVRERRSGAVLDKPGMKVPKGLEVQMESPARYVGRGGEKLESFFQSVSIILKDTVALDVGASTGGFTDFLLQNGASKVYAVDVGDHQLHEKLRVDSRVVSLENTDIRKISRAQIKEEPQLIVVDVSFISLRPIIQHLAVEFPRALFILLYKPQFEVGRYVPKKEGWRLRWRQKNHSRKCFCF